MAAPAVPSGKSAPAEIVNSTNHGALVTITTAIGLLLVIVCLLIGLYAKLTMRTLAGKMDLFLLGATVCCKKNTRGRPLTAALAQAVIIFVGVGKGLGSSVTIKDQAALSTIQKVSYLIICIPCLRADTT